MQRTRVVEAEQWFLRAKQLAPTEPSVYQHFGKFQKHYFSVVICVICHLSLPFLLSHFACELKEVYLKIFPYLSFWTRAKNVTVSYHYRKNSGR